MNIFDFIDNMITRLNKVNVAGLENMQVLLQTVKDLEQIKSVITIKEESTPKQEETDNAKNNDEQGENVPG